MGYVLSDCRAMWSLSRIWANENVHRQGMTHRSRPAFCCIAPVHALGPWIPYHSCPMVFACWWHVWNTTSPAYQGRNGWFRPESAAILPWWAWLIVYTSQTRGQIWLEACHYCNGNSQQNVSSMLELNTRNPSNDGIPTTSTSSLKEFVMLNELLTVAWVLFSIYFFSFHLLCNNYYLEWWPDSRQTSPDADHTTTPPDTTQCTAGMSGCTRPSRICTSEFTLSSTHRSCRARPTFHPVWGGARHCEEWVDQLRCCHQQHCSPFADCFHNSQGHAIRRYASQSNAGLTHAPQHRCPQDRPHQVPEQSHGKPTRIAILHQTDVTPLLSSSMDMDRKNDQGGLGRRT